MEPESKENPRNKWKVVNTDKYQMQVTIPSIASATPEADERLVFIDDLEKRKKVYGICGECNEPGTGIKWCKPCNAKRFKENFKNWTSGNKNIDEFIQDSQLNALSWSNRLEWVPFEKFQNVTYITKGGFGKIYSAEWPGGRILDWDIENQRWRRFTNYKVALKSLDNSSDISEDFLNEVKIHLQINLSNIVSCFGMTQDPNTKDYMMILRYYEHRDLKNYLKKSIDYRTKTKNLFEFARGLLDIHDAGLVHKDLHSGNLLFKTNPNTGRFLSSISDLGLSQPANICKKKSDSKEGIYGVLPYVAPEVLRGFQYTQAADIYSFGIIMNEFMSEEIPYDDISHDQMLAIKICKGLRPTISEDTPKLLADLIMKCWDVKPENRPTAKELFQITKKWLFEEIKDENSVLYSQVKECKKIKENKLKSKSSNEENEDKSKNSQIHPQAIYTSRLLSFKNLPEPVNSSDLLVDSSNSLDLLIIK